MPGRQLQKILIGWLRQTLGEQQKHFWRSLLVLCGVQCCRSPPPGLASPIPLPWTSKPVEKWDIFVVSVCFYYCKLLVLVHQSLGLTSSFWVLDPSAWSHQMQASLRAAPSMLVGLLFLALSISLCENPRWRPSESRSWGHVTSSWVTCCSICWFLLVSDGNTFAPMEVTFLEVPFLLDACGSAAGRLYSLWPLVSFTCDVWVPPRQSCPGVRFW